MERMLLYGLALNLLLVLGILVVKRRGWRPHTAAMGALLGYTVWQLVASPEGWAHGPVAVGLFCLLLLVPALFTWLVRHAARARRYRLAAALMTVVDLTLLQRSATGSVLRGMAQAREGKAEELIRGVRERILECPVPETRHELNLQLLMLLITAERYGEVVELFDEEEPGALQRWEPSATLLARSLGELGRWDEVARVVETLERAVPEQEGPWRAWYDQARLVFLAGAGHRRELDELFDGLSFAELAPRDVVERWRERAAAWEADPPLDPEIEHPGLVDLVVRRARQSAAMPRSMGWGPGLVPVTTALLLINLTFAAVAWWMGGSDTPRVLARLGCAYTPEVTFAEPWRLVTALFLHAGPIHLVTNMLALWLFGRLVEQTFGSVRFLAVYAFSAWVGLGMSLAWGGETLKVGASGGILGLVAGGAVLCWLERGSSRLPARYLKRMSLGLALTAVLSVLVGVFFPMIDNLAHLGGVGGGALAARVLRGGIRHRRSHTAKAVNRMAGAAAGLVLLAAAGLMAAHDPLKGAWRQVEMGGWRFEAPIWWLEGRVGEQMALVDHQRSLFLVKTYDGSFMLPREGNEPAPPPWLCIYEKEEVGKAPRRFAVHAYTGTRPEGDDHVVAQLIIYEPHQEGQKRFLPRLLRSVARASSKGDSNP